MCPKAVASELNLSLVLVNKANIFLICGFSLIARMLVREPEKRAKLEDLAKDSWLQEGSEQQQPAEYLPLISREHVSDEDHNIIIQKMVSGKIATKEEILE